jgi:RNA polymerase sigma-70 factor (ECF subfamily)
VHQTEFDAPAFLALLRQGDEAAYRRLIRRFHGSLVGVAASIIGSRAQAEEVVQDSWLAVYAGIGRFEGRSSLVTWLFSIVLNRARTRATSEGRTVGLPALMDGSPPGERAVPAGAFLPDGHWIDEPRLWDEVNPERIVGGRQLFDHAMDCIERLPAGQKAVIILRDLEGRAAEEACALLSISPENQRVLLHRARGRVRQTLDALIGAAPGASTARQGVSAPDAKHKPPPRGALWLLLACFGGRASPRRSGAVDSSCRRFDHPQRYAPAFFW